MVGCNRVEQGVAGLWRVGQGRAEWSRLKQGGVGLRWSEELSPLVTWSASLYRSPRLFICSQRQSPRVSPIYVCSEYCHLQATIPSGLSSYFLVLLALPAIFLSPNHSRHARITLRACVSTAVVRSVTSSSVLRRRDVRVTFYVF